MKARIRWPPTRAVTVPFTSVGICQHIQFWLFFSSIKANKVFFSAHTQRRHTVRWRLSPFSWITPLPLPHHHRRPRICFRSTSSATALSLNQMRYRRKWAGEREREREREMISRELLDFSTFIYTSQFMSLFIPLPLSRSLARSL